MADFLTKNLKMALSADVEATYNDMLDADGDLYYGLLASGRTFYVPDLEKVDDTGKIGTGREFPTLQRSTYVAIPSLEISDDLNIDTAALFLRRAMGGTDVVSTVVEASATIRDHDFTLDLTTNRQLPSSTMLWSLGGADYLWGGVVVESFAINQTAATDPTFTAGLLGSGLFKRLRHLTANGALAVNGSNAYTGPYAGATSTEYPPTFPAPTNFRSGAPEGEPFRYMTGSETLLTFTPTGGSLASLTTPNQRLRSVSLTLTNNHRTDDRRPGDPRVNATDPANGQASGNPCAGHYVNRMLHGDRNVAGEMSIMLDDTMAEFTHAYNDTVIQGFTYTARGCFLKNTAFTADTTKQAEFEVVLPKVYFRGLRGADDNGDAIINISLFSVDSTTGPMEARIRTDYTMQLV